MRLVIGGYAQGKLQYVTEQFSEIRIYTEENYQRLGSKGETKPVVINHLHTIIRKELAQGTTVLQLEQRLDMLMEAYPELILISDEIGCGIVPMEKEERRIREETGRLLTRCAKYAERVERVICGIPCRIK